MTWEQVRWQRELAEIFGVAYDPGFVPVWHAAWSDYEECGWIYVLERDGRYFVQEGGYSVMADDNTPCWHPYEVSDGRLWEILVDWEEHLD